MPMPETNLGLGFGGEGIRIRSFCLPFRDDFRESVFASLHCLVVEERRNFML
jgi:hypothetical protein